MAEDSSAVQTQQRASYPEDRFDHVQRSGRVGAHRVVAKPRKAWRYILAGAVAFALLTTGGILWLQTGGEGTGTSIAEQLRGEDKPKGPPPVVPEVDAEATVAIINGTEMSGLAAGVESEITINGWGQILFTGDAEAPDVTISAVFYTDPADEAAAAGLAAELGGLSTYENADYASYGSRLVVLLGSDYAGPGREDAEAAAPPAE